MNATNARAIAESYSADAENASHLESALNAITKAANSGKFQIALHVVGSTREFVLSELVKLGYQIQTIGENTIISW